MNDADDKAMPDGRNLRRKVRVRNALNGAAFAVLLCLACMPLLGIVRLDTYVMLLPAALAGALHRRRWLRRGLRRAGVAFCLLIFVIAFTPILDQPAKNLIREDVLRPADAVVALSSTVLKDGRLSSRALERLLEAMSLVNQGLAPALVRTRLPDPYPSPDFDVDRLLLLLQREFELLEVGPVGSTRDEAVKVAELAQERGWKRIILVTSPSHSSRAAAVFEKVGLEVISRPCLDRYCLIEDLKSPRERVTAFWIYLYEALARVKYKARGWM